MIPTNVFQAEFNHYPKQQQCAIDLLEKMEDNGRLIREKKNDKKNSTSCGIDLH